MTADLEGVLNINLQRTKRPPTRPKDSTAEARSDPVVLNDYFSAPNFFVFIALSLPINNYIVIK